MSFFLDSAGRNKPNPTQNNPRIQKIQIKIINNMFFQCRGLFHRRSCVYSKTTCCCREPENMPPLLYCICVIKNSTLRYVLVHNKEKRTVRTSIFSGQAVIDIPSYAYDRSSGNAIRDTRYFVVPKLYSRRTTFFPYT